MLQNLANILILIDNFILLLVIIGLGVLYWKNQLPRDEDQEESEQQDPFGEYLQGHFKEFEKSIIKTFDSKIKDIQKDIGQISEVLQAFAGEIGDIEGQEPLTPEEQQAIQQEVMQGVLTQNSWLSLFVSEETMQDPRKIMGMLQFAQMFGLDKLMGGNRGSSNGNIPQLKSGQKPYF